MCVLLVKFEMLEGKRTAMLLTYWSESQPIEIYVLHLYLHLIFFRHSRKIMASKSLKTHLFSVTCQLDAAFYSFSAWFSNHMFSHR